MSHINTANRILMSISRSSKKLTLLTNQTNPTTRSITLLSNNNNYAYTTTIQSRSLRSKSGKTPSSSNDTSITQTSKSSDGVVAIPVDFDVASTIEGNESQIVTVELEPGQVLRAESGAMLYMTKDVQMETTSNVSAGFKRFLTGQNVFISDYTYVGNSKGKVALGTDFPSKIIRLNVDQYHGKIVCQQGALLCASHTIDVEIEFTKNFTSGFFGGEGCK